MGNIIKNKDKPLVSIQRQYIIVAVLLGFIVISASIIGYLDMNTKSSRLVDDVKNISGLLEKTARIRNHIVIANRSIDTFMLEPERVEQKNILKVELEQAKKLIVDVKSNPTVQALSVDHFMDELLSNISFLNDESIDLFKIRVNTNAQYPAMEVSANVMRPSRNTIFSIFSITINEFQASEHLQKNKRVYDLLIYAQNAWISTISEYRLYLANRIGSFNEKRLIEQEVNVETYIERMEAVAKMLQAYNEDWMFGFEGSDLIKKLPIELEQWKTGFLKVKEINHSKRWRQDSQLMRDSIVPLLNAINHSLLFLDEKIKVENNESLTRLSRLGFSQSLVLSGVILLFLIYITISILALKRFIIKPIALIAKTLKNEAFGQTRLETLKLRKTLETQDLIDAFNEMSHQVFQRQQALEHQALNDSLTSLPNRLKLQERLDYHLKIAHRENSSLFFMMLDLNRFKEVNDTLGHHIGDQLLIQVGKRLKELLRDIDSVARLGGDEFAIFFPNTDIKSVVIIAKKINKAIETPFKVHQHSLQISASIGLSQYPDDGMDMNILMQHADVAMYHAKKNKTGYSFYDASIDTHSVDRLSLGSELKQAIDDDQLALFYQPKYELYSGKIIGAEALLRWQHPVSGFISPEFIIDTAEHSGIINELTYWVLDHAISSCAQCHQNGFQYNLAINLSVQNLRDNNLYYKINETLKHYGLASHFLTLEITESAMMTNPEESIEILNLLCENGIKLSVDDFGTGFSSLAYLKQLPVSELKIDKSFIIDMKEDESDKVIVRSTIDLGHNLGLKVVAEGVENQESWDMLENMNCDFAQGFFMSRPLCSEDFKQWLKKGIKI